MRYSPNARVNRVPPAKTTPCLASNSPSNASRSLATGWCCARLGVNGAAITLDSIPNPIALFIGQVTKNPTKAPAGLVASQHVLGREIKGAAIVPADRFEKREPSRNVWA